ncbi:peptidase [Candidatus Magnetomorum sp. HK-1]|nr:peptidase [Candidatus Magnetomorum sp. HK-1]
MKKFLPIILIWAIALTISSCLYIEVDTGARGGPALYHPDFQFLKGVSLEKLVVKTDHTIADMIFKTSLIRKVAKNSRKAVVSIYAKTKQPYRIHLLPIPIIGSGLPVRVPGIGLGSGFFIHPSGYLLTNNHVIQRAEKIKVLTHDDSDYEVIVVARDPVYDLALLKVVGDNHSFPVIPMGNSDAIDSGDMVIAVGNPLGLGHTVTSGIISHTGRNLSGVSEKKGRHVSFIQTDAAINPGSSGGPLITLTGAWIGINTAGAITGEGIGFAVPGTLVHQFLEMIRTGEWK